MRFATWAVALLGPVMATCTAPPSALADGWRVETLTADGVRFFVHGTELSPGGRATVLLSRRERARGGRPQETHLELWRGRRARRLFSSRLCCVPITAELQQGSRGGPVAVWRDGQTGPVGLLDHGRVRTLRVRGGTVRSVDLDVAGDGSAAIAVVAGTAVYVTTRSRFSRFGPLRLVARDDTYDARIATASRGSGVVAWQSTDHVHALGFEQGERRSTRIGRRWSRAIRYDGGSGPLVRPLLSPAGRGLITWGDSDHGLLATPWPAATGSKRLVAPPIEDEGMGTAVSRGRIWLSWADAEDAAVVVRRWGPRGGVRDRRTFQSDVVPPLLIADRRGGVYVLGAFFNDSRMVRIRATGRAERGVPLPRKAALGAGGAVATGSRVLLAWAERSSSGAARVRIALRSATPVAVGRSR